MHHLQVLSACISTWITIMDSTLGLVLTAIREMISPEDASWAWWQVRWPSTTDRQKNNDNVSSSCTVPTPPKKPRGLGRVPSNPKNFNKNNYKLINTLLIIPLNIVWNRSLGARFLITVSWYGSITVSLFWPLESSRYTVTQSNQKFQTNTYVIGQHKFLLNRKKKIMILDDKSMKRS